MTRTDGLKAILSMKQVCQRCSLASILFGDLIYIDIPTCISFTGTIPSIQFPERGVQKLTSLVERVEIRPEVKIIIQETMRVMARISKCPDQVVM